MGAYQQFIWEKFQPIIACLPEDKKSLAISFQQEACSLAAQQIHSAHHVAACAAKNMAVSVILRRHAWLRSSGFREESKPCIEDLPFDEEALFNTKTNNEGEDLHKKKTTARKMGLNIYVKCTQKYKPY